MRVISIVGIMLGSLIMFGSYIRWTYVYVDQSQALFGATIGVIIIGAFYLFDRIDYHDKQILNLHHRIDSIIYPERGKE